MSSTWPAPAPLTPQERQDELAPFGRGWQKLIEAFERKLEMMTDDGLEQLIEACQAGRWHHDLDGSNYAASFEVERQARAMVNRRKAERKVKS